LRIFLAAQARHQRNVHHVSKGHLHRYCSEFEFRYNTRTALGVTDSQRARLLARGAEGSLCANDADTDSGAALRSSHWQSVFAWGRRRVSGIAVFVG
jgi:hypothetical protein